MNESDYQKMTDRNMLEYEKVSSAMARYIKYLQNKEIDILIIKGIIDRVFANNIKLEVKNGRKRKL